MSRTPRDEIYSIWQQHFDSYDEGLKALKSQAKTLKRLAAKYPSCVYVMGLSTHNGKYAKKVNLNEGKCGHPKVGFVPKSDRYKESYEEGIHIHIFIGGLYAASLATEFTDLQNKLYQQKKHHNHVNHVAVLLIKVKHGFFPLKYVQRQSTNIRYSNKKAVREYAEERIKITRFAREMRDQYRSSNRF